MFLDELGELPKDLQPKLLRVLEKREVRRVGGLKTIPIDVRVIAATNRNMLGEVQRGQFRQDLYLRRRRARDRASAARTDGRFPPAAGGAFLAHERPPRSIEDVAPEIWEMFRSYRWPGNVRELRHAVQRLRLVTPERALREVMHEFAEPSARGRKLRAGGRPGARTSAHSAPRRQAMRSNEITLRALWSTQKAM